MIYLVYFRLSHPADEGILCNQSSVLYLEKPSDARRKLIDTLSLSGTEYLEVIDCYPLWDRIAQVETRDGK